MKNTLMKLADLAKLLQILSISGGGGGLKHHFTLD